MTVSLTSDIPRDYFHANQMPPVQYQNEKLVLLLTALKRDTGHCTCTRITVGSYIDGTAYNFILRITGVLVHYVRTTMNAQ